MKLIFTKEGNNEVSVKMQGGTVIEDFSYTEMVKQLLSNNEFEDTVFNGLTEDEEARINNMLGKIKEAFQEEKEELGN